MSKQATFESTVNKPGVGGPMSGNSSQRSTKTEGAVGSKTNVTTNSNISNPLTDEEAQVATGLMAHMKAQQEPVEGEAKPSPQEVEALKKKDLLVADAKKLNDSVKSLKKVSSAKDLLIYSTLNISPPQIKEASWGTMLAGLGGRLLSKGVRGVGKFKPFNKLYGKVSDRSIWDWTERECCLP